MTSNETNWYAVVNRISYIKIVNICEKVAANDF